MGYIVAFQVGKNSQSAIYLAGLALVGGFVGLYMALSMAELSYLVFPGAFAEKRGGEVKIFRWDQVREVYETLHPAWRSFRVVTRKGHDIELTANTQGHVELGERIERELMKWLWPEWSAELDRGGTVRFGTLGVSRTALHTEFVTSPWHQTTMSIRMDPEPVRGTAIYSNLMHLFIYTQAQTKAAKVEISKIPNFRLFLELVRQNWPQSLPD